MSASTTRRKRSRYPLVPENVLAHGQNFWRREVIVDFHGVVVDWTTKFCRFASKTLNRPGITPEKVQYYYPGYGADMPMSPSEFEELFSHFARLAKGGYGDLEAYPGIVRALKQIRKAGIDLQIWTWTPGPSETSFYHSTAFGSGVSQGVTKTLIRTLGLPVDERKVKFLSPGQKLFKMAEDHIPLIIEDNPMTAITAGVAFGHACIMMPQPFNEGVMCPGVTRLSKHSQLAPVVIRFFDQLEKAGVLL